VFRIRIGNYFTDPHRRWIRTLRRASKLIKIYFNFFDLPPLHSVNVPKVRSKHKNFFFLASWKLLAKRAGSGSVIQCVDPRIRICIKMSRIRNTGNRYHSFLRPPHIYLKITDISKVNGLHFWHRTLRTSRFFSYAVNTLKSSTGRAGVWFEQVLLEHHSDPL